LNNFLEEKVSFIIKYETKNSKMNKYKRFHLISYANFLDGENSNEFFPLYLGSFDNILEMSSILTDIASFELEWAKVINKNNIINIFDTKEKKFYKINEKLYEFHAVIPSLENLDEVYEGEVLSTEEFNKMLDYHKLSINFPHMIYSSNRLLSKKLFDNRQNLIRL